ncbi:hypothetical protein BJ138DRAFT_1183842 [Hygrophoropsis aurantiaca]|uniref:Uncharacterized protein n=1 Tax=Hygrophoropsis aurantiaca TaxID=72124 RepID=A0ACB7ZVW1_9AGAM|nr:hypothetical protein BJ138DRAFT_1183842 [Hygrophoropsis aurantiaca]
MSINYTGIVSQDGIAYNPHHYQLALSQANGLGVSQAQSNSAPFAAHWHPVSTEPMNFDQAMAQQYITMLQQLIEPQGVPCHIVSGGLPCGDLIGVTKAEVSQHLRRRHGVRSASRGMTCAWDGGCAAQPMRGDSLARHVVSKHLGTGKVMCGVCGKRYARRDAFKSHLVNGIQCDGTQLGSLAV